jgi:hypothetical protein
VGSHSNQVAWFGSSAANVEAEQRLNINIMYIYSERERERELISSLFMPCGFIQI